MLTHTLSHQAFVRIHQELRWRALAPHLHWRCHRIRPHRLRSVHCRGSFGGRAVLAQFLADAESATVRRRAGTAGIDGFGRSVSTTSNSAPETSTDCPECVGDVWSGGVWIGVSRQEAVNDSESFSCHYCTGIAAGQRVDPSVIPSTGLMTTFNSHTRVHEDVECQYTGSVWQWLGQTRSVPFHVPQ